MMMAQLNLGLSMGMGDGDSGEMVDSRETIGVV